MLGSFRIKRQSFVLKYINDLFLFNYFINQSNHYKNYLLIFDFKSYYILIYLSEITEKNIQLIIRK